LSTFRRWRSRQAALAFGVATGRSFHSAMAILEQVERGPHRLPLPAGRDGLAPGRVGRVGHAVRIEMARVRARLARAGLRASVIHSHGRYLDVLPERASKASPSRPSSAARIASRFQPAATVSRQAASAV
jgi:sucrose-phosphate synthase